MSQVIRISDDLYKRLESYATGFDTPSRVIELILDEFEVLKLGDSKTETNDAKIHMAPSSTLDIVYCAGTEETFKEQLLETKKAFLKIHYSDGSNELKEWDASRFSEQSRVDGNLRSGYLRGWKNRGIIKAELTVNRKDLDM